MKPGTEPAKALQAEAARLELAAAFASLREVNKTLAFLLDLCTPAELQAMASRWQVAVMLDAGQPYRRIHELTGVSTATVTRVARFIESGFGGYKEALRRRQQGSPTLQPNEQHRESQHPHHEHS